MRTWSNKLEGIYILTLWTMTKFVVSLLRNKQPLIFSRYSSIGSGCTIVWHTNAISAVLDLGQETKPHISPIRPLTPEEQLESVKKLEGLPNKEHKNCKLKLFLEVDLGLVIQSHSIIILSYDFIAPMTCSRINVLFLCLTKDILHFFKLYEPEKRKLSEI
ncbi:unnamed protein product [Malus baccata var. baccata]